MESNINNIKGLTSVPKEFTRNSRAIESLYQNNPNIFDNVDEPLILSSYDRTKLLQLINDGTFVLTENNIKLLWSFGKIQSFIDILKNHFNYLYLINQNIFCYPIYYIVKHKDFINLLEEHQVEISDNTPYLVTMCSEYIIKQYINDKVDIANILPYFKKWDNVEQEKVIREYLKKGNYDLSIFLSEDKEGNITSYFKNIIIEENENNIKIIASNTNIDEILFLLDCKLPFNNIDIYILDNRLMNRDLLNLLRKTNQENINLHVKNGLSMCSNLKDNFEFLELCGNVGNVQLVPFELENFKKLLSIVEQHPGVVINVQLNNFMKYESFFLNLCTEIPINIVSEKNVSILPLNKMKELNLVFEKMVSEIKNSMLTPFEKYIAAYNIVKSFKNYRFYLDNKGFDKLVSDQSRNPYLILINQYIVCAGYASLLQILLSKLDIPSHYWSLNNSKNSEYVLQNELIFDGHARLYVNIVDDKYGINGYYMCDPTWDNVDKVNSDLNGYQYLCMTCEESHDFAENSSSYYFFADDVEAFNDQMFLNTNEYLEKANSLDEIFDIVKDLDPEFYTQLAKLENLEEQKEAIKFHFNDKTNQVISSDTRYKAIVSVLKFQKKRELHTTEKQILLINLNNSKEHGGIVFLGGDNFDDESILDENAPIIKILTSGDSDMFWNLNGDTPIIKISSGSDSDDFDGLENDTPIVKIPDSSIVDDNVNCNKKKR